MTHSIINFIKPFFSHYLPIQKGLAPNTIIAYRDAVKLVLCYTADTLHKNVEELYVEDINNRLFSISSIILKIHGGAMPEPAMPDWQLSVLYSALLHARNLPWCFTAR